MKEFLRKKNIIFSAKRYGIDALGAMAQGLFASLLIGTIISTLGEQLGIGILVTVGGYAKGATGAAMAISIGVALQCPPLVLFSLAAVGMAANELGGAGGPLAVLVVTIFAAEFGKLVSKVYKAKAINKDDLDEAESMEDSIRYITRTAEDNGCEMRAVLSDVDRKKIEKRNAITIGDTTATCFYQDEQFITGDHMIVIRADWLNKYTAMFILTFLKNEQFKYSYGRAYLMDRVKETIVKLPYKKSDDGSPLLDETHKYSDEGYIPDWDYMEKYIKSLPYGDRI